MNNLQPWSRRNFLRGLGTTLALPTLESVVPLKGLAASKEVESPLRVAFMFVPNGVHMPDWTPTTQGAHFELPKILSSLTPVKHDLTILSGLTHDKDVPMGMALEIMPDPPVFI